MKNNSKNQMQIERLKSQGVDFVIEESVIIADNVEVGEGSSIYPFVVLANNVKIGKNTKIFTGAVINGDVTIGDNVTIQAHSHICGNVKIFNDVRIGQYTLIRDEVSVGQKTTIGPHCEVVRSTIGCYCKLGHRNYVADAMICDYVYFGVGASIANSNWDQTFSTIIESHVKIGANATLIAPIKVGTNSFIAAGTTISKEVPSNTLCIGRSEPIFKPLNNK